MYEAGFSIENNILKGKETSHRSDYTSLGKFLLDRLDNNLDFVGQVDTVTGEECTHKKMRERSVRCALWMKSQGLLLGDVVSICSHNQIDVVMPCLAALYLGAAFSPLEEGSSKNELSHLLNITKPKMMFASVESASVVAEAAKEVKLDLKIIVFGQVPGFLEFESVIAEPGVSEVKSFECTPIDKLDTIAYIVSTSGTTGTPKGVAISHASALRQIYFSKGMLMTNNICLTFSSISWITGIFNIFWCLYLNISRLIVPSFEEYSAFAIVEKYKVSWILMAPHMINKSLKSDALTKYDLSSLKYVLCGGAPLTYASQKAFAQYVPNAQFMKCYGLTEIGRPFALQGTKSKPGSVGRILGNGQLKVIDRNTGQLLGANQRGELLLKTTTMMNGYYLNPQATAMAIDEEGWMHTGDFGYYDEDGEIFVVDRLKELILYRSFHICPSVIESLILAHPGVKDAAVVGLPHPLDDEHPIAFVVRSPDSIGTEREVTENELIDLVAAEMSESKRLHGGVKFVDRIPRTPHSGKIQRRVLRDLARSMITISQDSRDQ